MFSLPLLPYEEHSLEPYISAQTVKVHYGKHHKTYLDNLNNLVQGTAFENASLEEIIIKSDGSIFNNGAQVWNHTFYWHCLKPGGSEIPEEVMQVIIRDFGTFEQFKEEFSRAAATLFGSGWTWLVFNSEKKLQIVQESNAGNPLRRGLKPLLTCDVWEHAYYLDKQNRRMDYIIDFWKIVNWDFVRSNF